MSDSDNSSGQNRWTSPVVWFWVALAILVPLSGFRTVSNEWFSRPPKPVGDGLDYENLAFHVWQGKGFIVDNTSAPWRELYEQEPDEYAYHLGAPPRALVSTGRPPLFPAVVAAIYGVVGRTPMAMAAVRLLLSICIAISGALATAVVVRLFRGNKPAEDADAWCVASGAAAVIALFAANRTLHSYSTDFLTEPIALLLCQMFVSMSIFGSDASPNNRSRFALAVGKGVVWGALILTRSMFVLWLPMIAVLSFVSEARSQRLRSSGILLATAILVCSPWWIRNIAVLGEFMPLGTQGPITLLGGYCSQALENNGDWQLEPELRLRSEFASEVALEANRAASAIELGTQSEVAIAQRASTRVKGWIASNIRKLPELGMARVWTHWNPYSGPSLVWKIAALIGVVLLVGSRERAGCWLIGFPLVSTLVVAFLYTVGGRFLVPLYGVLFSVAGYAVGRLMQIGFRTWSSKHSF